MGCAKYAKTGVGFAGLVTLFFVFSTVSLYASSELRPELSSDTVLVGSGLTWSLYISDTSDPDSVSIIEVPQMEGGVLTSPPDIRENYVGIDGKNVQKGVVVVCVFHPNEAGIKKIGKAVFQVGQTRTIVAEEKAVEVQIRHHGKAVLPPQIELKPNKTVVYEGESILVQLILKERRIAELPRRIEMELPENDLFEEVKGTDPIQRYQIADMTVFDLPLAVLFYTPTAVGKIRMPSVSVAFDEFGKVSTPSKEIEVLPLPALAKQNGAVGDFSFSVFHEKKKLSEGDFLDIDLVLEGRGNFGQLTFPSLKTSNLSEVEQKTEDLWRRDGDRFSGVQRIQYRFVVEKGGIPVVFSVPEWGWFSPTQKRVVKSNGVFVSIPTDAVDEVLEEHFFAESYQPFSPSLVENNREYNPMISPFSGVVFLPGVLLLIFFAVFIIVRRKKFGRIGLSLLVVFSFFLLMSFLIAESDSAEKPEGLTDKELNSVDVLNEAQAAFESKDFERAAALWEFWEIQTENDRNSRLCFNRALAAVRGDLPEAVFQIRKAISLKPLDSVYRKFYEELKDEYGLQYSVKTVPAVSALIAFICAGIAFNLAVLFLVLSVLLKKRSLSIAVVTWLAILTVSMGFLILYVSAQVKKNAILTESAFLLKTPRPYSSGILEMPLGTTVAVLGETEEFLIVRNDLGITGWIEKSKTKADF